MINVLPQHIVSKIAAGEVVERPVSIVKELVENSIDAGSTYIRVDIEKGGKDFIRIIDNGHGVLQEDLPKTIAPHATSKLQSIEDLDHIGTFGFRGEALSSIAAVSQFSIQSKHDSEDQGSILISKNGEIKIKPDAIEKGTIIEISDLFYSVPARRKYLKSDHNEYEQILKFLMVQFLVHPEIEFHFYSNQKEVLNLPQVDTMEERIADVYGSEMKEKLVSIYYEGSDIKIRGMVSKPQESVKRNPIQHILVNKRVVTNKTIAGAVLAGYEDLLMVGMKPQYVISLDIAPEEVDCNIHPRKAEVRFHRGNEVFINVKRAIQKAFQQEPMRPVMNVGQGQDQRQGQGRGEGMRSSYNSPSFSAQPSSVQDAMSFYKPNSEKMSVDGFAQEDVSFEKEVSDLKIIGQIHNSYILLETARGLLLVDQHAAHERINYEMLQQRHRTKEAQSQQLTVPFIMELSPFEYTVWEDSKEFLSMIGFQTEAFGGKTITIQGIPVELKKEKVEVFFQDILRDFSDTEKKHILNKTVDEKLASVACRMSVMFGDVLSHVEQKQLVEDLQKLDYEYCPHGRPATIEVTLGELEKFFKRTHI